jgi:hypothetical protein
MEIEDIKKYYEKLPDSEIIRISTSDAQGLRPEVFEIIENEIKKRNLNPDILNGAIAQNKEYSESEVESYSNLLRDLPCPICGNAREKLNGTISFTVKSFLVFTSYSAIPTIACPSCLDNKNSDAIFSTLLFGWWGIPWGILKTPVYIYRNYKAKKENRIHHSNNTLLLFTLQNIGKIETYKESKSKLAEIIKPEL